ncbi:hypothetical protein, partial [Exiguobacterium sp. SH3S2]|uniref:hypothetical protein n=1 Tax=Exiguobacterium sp. SH3S2 TaxID=2510956 RepID=UPI0013762858
LEARSPHGQGSRSHGLVRIDRVVAVGIDESAHGVVAFAHVGQATAIRVLPLVDHRDQISAAAARDRATVGLERGPSARVGKPAQKVVAILRQRTRKTDVNVERGPGAVGRLTGAADDRYVGNVFVAVLFSGRAGGE